MADRKDWVNSEKLTALNDTIAKRGSVDREDILTVLKLVDTTDATIIVEEIKSWLKSLSDNPKFVNITLPDADIDAVLGDLGSYGVVQSITILKLKDNSNRNML